MEQVFDRADEALAVVREAEAERAEGGGTFAARREDLGAIVPIDRLYAERQANEARG